MATAGARLPTAGGLSPLGIVQARLSELNRQHGAFTVKPPEVLTEMAGLNEQLLKLSQVKPVLSKPTLSTNNLVVVSAEGGPKLSTPANTLVEEFHQNVSDALAMATFDTRNTHGAEGIAKQSAAFAAAAIAGNGKIESALYDVFFDTVRKGSDGLASSFTPLGTPNGAKVAEFQAALVKGREVTTDAMPSVLAALDNARGVPVKGRLDYQLEVQQALKNTRLDDLADMLATQLKTTNGKTGLQLKQELGIIVPEEDSRQAEISRIVVRRPSEGPMTPREKEVFGLKSRLDQAVFLGQQIHRAAFGDGARPDMQWVDLAATQGRFDAYDASHLSTYRNALKTDPKNAFLHALWEFYKETWPK
ncbi:MAG: hypothetical protein K1X64_12490 [Myxococcaceae bacterium]|nr:hypothetical protein [Myxococcaceae bacterium]